MSLHYEYDENTKFHWCVLCCNMFNKLSEVNKHFKTDSHNIEYLIYWNSDKYDEYKAKLFLEYYPEFKKLYEPDKRAEANKYYENFCKAHNLK